MKRFIITLVLLLTFLSLSELNSAILYPPSGHHWVGPSQIIGQYVGHSNGSTWAVFYCRYSPSEICVKNHGWGLEYHGVALPDIPSDATQTTFSTEETGSGSSIKIIDKNNLLLKSDELDAEVEIID